MDSDTSPIPPRILGAPDVADQTIRQVCIQIANACVGLTAPSQAYLDLVAPNERRWEAAAIAQARADALVVRAVWRLLGVRGGRLALTFRIGAAMSDLSLTAMAVGAWIPSRGHNEPPLGACVVTGEGKTQNVAIVTGYDREHAVLVAGTRGAEPRRVVRTAVPLSSWKSRADQLVAWIDVARLRPLLSDAWQLPARQGRDFPSGDGASPRIG